MCTRRDNTDMSRHPHGKISRLTGVIAITLCALILAPIAAPNPALAQQPTTKKPAKTTSVAPVRKIPGFKRHMDRKYGFAFSVPAIWRAATNRSGQNLPTQYIVALFKNRGTNCQLGVLAREFDGEGGQPYGLKTYLSKMGDRFRNDIRSQGRLVQDGTGQLGGQAARRFVMDRSVNGKTVRGVEYLTLRTNGIFMLRCSAPHAEFDQPKTQEIFEKVRKSFRFFTPDRLEDGSRQEVTQRQIFRRHNG